MKYTLLTLALALLAIPQATAACGPASSMSGIMETPYSARGQFVFIRKISRRTLLATIAHARAEALAPLPSLLQAQL